MKILINGLSAVMGGGVTFLAEFVPQIARVGRFDEFVVLVNRSFAPPPGWQDLPPNVSVRRYRMGIAGRLLFEQAILPLLVRREGIDLLFSIADVGSLLAPCSQVVAVRNFNIYHPSIPSPSLKKRLRLALLYRLARLSARRADRVVFVSETAMAGILPTLAIPAQKVRTIHHGVNPAWGEKTMEGTLAERFGLRQPYFLAVSSIYPNKNYINLVEGYARIASQTRLDLVIVGTPFDKGYYGALLDRIAARGLTRRVHLLGSVPHDQLPSLYKGATAVVHPSTLETFGHPLVEAMRMGKPIVASDIPIVHEITAGAAITFDPHDPEAIAAALLDIGEDPLLQTESSQRGRSRAEDFSWEKCAQAYLDLFEEIYQGKVAERYRCTVTP